MQIKFSANIMCPVRSSFGRWNRPTSAIRSHYHPLKWTPATHMLPTSRNN